MAKRNVKTVFDRDIMQPLGRILEDMFTDGYSIGSSASPVAFAGDHFTDWWLSLTSAAGTYAAFRVEIANTIARTGGKILGASVNVNPLAGVATGALTGIEGCVYISGTVTVSDIAVAVFAEIQGGTTIYSDMYALYAYMAPGATPAGSSAVIRAEHNAAAARCKDGFLACVGDAAYTFSFGPTDNNTAWKALGTTTTQSGWLKVIVGSSVRYIPLYTTVS